MQNIREWKCFCKALCVLEVLALTLLLLQWECVRITAGIEVAYILILASSVMDSAAWGLVKHWEETGHGCNQQTKH